MQDPNIDTITDEELAKWVPAIPPPSIRKIGRDSGFEAVQRWCSALVELYHPTVAGADAGMGFGAGAGAGAGAAAAYGRYAGYLHSLDGALGRHVSYEESMCVVLELLLGIGNVLGDAEGDAAVDDWRTHSIEVMLHAKMPPIADHIQRPAKRGHIMGKEKRLQEEFCVIYESLVSDGIMSKILNEGWSASFWRAAFGDHGFDVSAYGEIDGGPEYVYDERYVLEQLAFLNQIALRETCLDGIRAIGVAGHALTAEVHQLEIELIIVLKRYVELGAVLADEKRTAELCQTWDGQHMIKTFITIASVTRLDLKTHLTSEVLWNSDSSEYHVAVGAFRLLLAGLDKHAAQIPADGADRGAGAGAGAGAGDAMEQMRIRMTSGIPKHMLVNAMHFGMEIAVLLDVCWEAAPVPVMDPALAEMGTGSGTGAGAGAGVGMNMDMSGSGGDSSGRESCLSTEGLFLSIIDSSRWGSSRGGDGDGANASQGRRRRPYHYSLFEPHFVKHIGMEVGDLERLKNLAMQLQKCHAERRQVPHFERMAALFAALMHRVILLSTEIAGVEAGDGDGSGKPVEKGKGKGKSKSSVESVSVKGAGAAMAAMPFDFDASVCPLTEHDAACLGASVCASLILRDGDKLETDARYGCAWTDGSRADLHRTWAALGLLPMGKIVEVGTECSTKWFNTCFADPRRFLDIEAALASVRVFSRSKAAEFADRMCGGDFIRKCHSVNGVRALYNTGHLAEALELVKSRKHVAALVALLECMAPEHIDGAVKSLAQQALIEWYWVSNDGVDAFVAPGNNLWNALLGDRGRFGDGHVEEVGSKVMGIIRKVDKWGDWEVGTLRRHCELAFLNKSIGGARVGGGGGIRGAHAHRNLCYEMTALVLANFSHVATASRQAQVFNDFMIKFRQSHGTKRSLMNKVEELNPEAPRSRRKR